MRGNPVCIKCETEESSLWTNAENLGAVCLDCLQDLGIKKDTADKEEEKDEKTTSTMRRTRSMRTPVTPVVSKQATKQGNKSTHPKGKSRRLIFKKLPTKAPSAVATPVTSDSVFYKVCSLDHSFYFLILIFCWVLQGMYFQKGDIVSLLDEDDNVYYAQLRGFLTDQYCEKSAVITWLLPTQESPPPVMCFDPATYITGPEEEIPRNLDCMEFVMHAPSDYYKSKITPYPSVFATPEEGYIWTRLEPIKRLLHRPPDNEDVSSVTNDNIN